MYKIVHFYITFFVHSYIIINTEKEKYEIIKPVLENFKSQTQVSKEPGINVGLIFQ